jgi:hypothetical protein
MKSMKVSFCLLLAGTSLYLLTSSAYSQSGRTCPPPGKEVPFAKVMNDAFAPDYVDCDITVKVEFIAAGGTPNYYWGSVRGTADKVPFRVVAPGEQAGGGAFDIPPHVFLPKEKADVIFSFKKGDLLIVRGAPAIGPIKGVPAVFIATDLIVANVSDAAMKQWLQSKSAAAAVLPTSGGPEAVAGAQEAKKVQEPEYIGVVFSLNSEGTLFPLERQQPNIQTKVKAFGYGGAQSSSVFKGSRSPVRFKAGQDIEFIVRLNLPGIEPDTLIELNVLKVSKDQREIIMEKVGAMGMSSKSSNGETLRTLNFAKYGEQSLKISPAAPLEPGEYVITTMGGQSGFLFGIDPK